MVSFASLTLTNDAEYFPGKSCSLSTGCLRELKPNSLRAGTATLQNKPIKPCQHAGIAKEAITAILRWRPHICFGIAYIWTVYRELQSSAAKFTTSLYVELLDILQETTFFKLSQGSLYLYMNFAHKEKKKLEHAAAWYTCVHKYITRFSPERILIDLTEERSVSNFKFSNPHLIHSQIEIYWIW